MELTHQDPPEPTDEEIALAAYRIWLQEGSPHGNDRDNWLKAREQLIEAKAREREENAAGENSSQK